MAAPAAEKGQVDRRDEIDSLREEANKNTSPRHEVVNPND